MMQTRDALKLIICFKWSLNRLVRPNRPFLYIFFIGWYRERERGREGVLTLLQKWMRNQVVKIDVINDQKMISLITRWYTEMKQSDVRNGKRLGNISIPQKMTVEYGEVYNFKVKLVQFGLFRFNQIAFSIYFICKTQKMFYATITRESLALRCGAY